MRTLRLSMSGVLAITLTLTAYVSVTAIDDECVQRAWELPIETMSVPESLAWDDLQVGNDGLYGSLYGTGHDPLFAPVVHFGVRCVHDPVGLMNRDKQLLDHIRATEVLEAPAGLGPDATAFKVTAEGSYNKGNMTIQWLRGDLVAEVESWDLKTFEVLRDLSLALDALLPEGEPEPAAE